MGIRQELPPDPWGSNPRPAWVDNKLKEPPQGTPGWKNNLDRRNTPHEGIPRKPKYPSQNAKHYDDLIKKTPTLGGKTRNPPHPFKTPRPNQGNLTNKLPSKYPFKNGLPKTPPKGKLGKRLAAGAGAAGFGSSVVGATVSELSNMFANQPYPTTLNNVDPWEFCELTGSCRVTDSAPFQRAANPPTRPGIPDNLKNKGHQRIQYLASGIYYNRSFSGEGWDEWTTPAQYIVWGPIIGAGYYYVPGTTMISHAGVVHHENGNRDAPIKVSGLSASDPGINPDNVSFALTGIEPLFEKIDFPPPNYNPTRAPYNPAKPLLTGAGIPVRSPGLFPAPFLPLTPGAIPSVPATTPSGIPSQSPFQTPTTEPTEEEENPLTPPFRPPFVPPSPLFSPTGSAPGASPGGKPSAPGSVGGAAPGGGTDTPPQDSGSSPPVSPPPPKKKCKCQGLEEGEEPMVVKHVPINVTDPVTGLPTTVHVLRSESGSDVAATRLLFSSLRQQNTQRSTIQGQVAANNGMLATGAGSVLGTISSNVVKVWSGIKILLNNPLIDRFIAIINLVFAIHNGIQLSSNIGLTVAETIDMALSLINIQPWKRLDENGNEVPLSTSEAASGKVKEIIEKIIGKERYIDFSIKWLKANRIYQAGANVLDSTRNIADTILQLNELTANATGKIGNGLKRAGVVMEDAYEWFDENIERFRNSTSKFRFLDKLREVQEGVETIEEIVSSTVEIKESVIEFNEARNEFSEAVKEAQDLNSNFWEQEKRNSKVRVNLSDLELSEIEGD